jgi:FkbM family methyltransferase
MSNIFQKLRQYGLYRFIQFGFAEFKSKFYYQLFFDSYSQFQEDLILDKLLRYKKRGFYIDIGAYDPFRFSNTQKFYKKGWSGINIEPNKALWKNFLTYRPRDTNLNVGIASKKGVYVFYLFSPSTISTFSKKQAGIFKKQGFNLVGTTRVKITTLADIITKYAKEKEVDFISIDVEGIENEVLRGNNWRIFRPRFICIESVLDHTIHKYIESKGYRCIYQTDANSFYERT